MSAQRLESQLLFPDNSTSHREIISLIAAGEYTGANLPDVAHKFLDAFCSSHNSDGRRRWTGIALVDMMRASATVIQRLKKLTKGPSRVGQIILDRKETEERRIIAGLIIRQGLDGGIAFADFWTSDKVVQSAPNFPRDADEEWMCQFQSYLDTLSSLKLANMTTDPVIMYPIFLSASDGFQWTGRSAVATIEEDRLTVVMSSSTLTSFQFIDLPVSHIKETRVGKESPHESQEDQSGHSLHTLHIVLHPGRPTYRLDASDRTASELKVSFSEFGDAAEFEAGIHDALKTKVTPRSAAPRTTRSRTSTSLKQDSHRSMGQHTHVPLDSGPQEAQQRPKTSSQQISDRPALTEEFEDGQRPSFNATGEKEKEKEKGRLSSVSKETIQKVVNAHSLPPGPSKGTNVTKGRKARAAKNVTSIIESSSDEDEPEEEDGESSQDEFELKSTASLLSSIKPRTGKASRGWRKAITDEDFVPDRPNPKSSSVKRKRDSNGTTAHAEPATKKTRTAHKSASRLSAGHTTAINPNTDPQKVAKLDHPQGRKPIKQLEVQQDHEDDMSPRHSLIGTLLKSRSPSGTAAPAFKRPGQPASTPGRARAQPMRTTPKTQTSSELRRDLDDLPTFFQTSTPRSQSIHDDDFGVGCTTVDTEILSSNTKRVPDSPHAESTAISGHADHEAVHDEKRRGDLETAKSDPFQKQGQTVLTSFTRKLTGESLTDSRTEHNEPMSVPEEPHNDESEAHELASDSASQPLPRESPSLLKHRTHNRRQMQPHKAFEDLPVISEESRKTNMTAPQETARALTFGDVRTSRNSAALHRKQAAPPDRPSPAPVVASKTCQCSIQDMEQTPAQPNESVISAPPEPVEDTLPEGAGQQADMIDLDGETTLIDEDNDMPEVYHGRASALKFRSSPPIPDSSSVREPFSDASEPEPELSPPTSRAEEMEWEASLEPHQRDLHEQMLRTSKRVVRHIVDNETAVTDISDAFADDGERLLGLFIERQSDESAKAFRELAARKEDLLKELTDASKALKRHRKQVKADD